MAKAKKAVKKPAKAKSPKGRGGAKISSAKKNKAAKKGKAGGGGGGGG
jgi:hypothetical protein